MKRYCFWIVISMLSFSAVCGCKSSNTSIGGGETNWLKKCTSDLDCGDGISCECGICTKSCQSSDECSDVPGAAGCLVTEPLDDGTCRVAAVGESSQGICVARCETDGDCDRDKDFKCISGVCTAIIEEKTSNVSDAGTIYGLIFPGSDAGNSYPLWLYDATDADGLGILSENTDAGDSVTVADAIDRTFPQCPCTADVEPGERAPTMEAYQDNAYGGPEWEWVMQREDWCLGDVGSHMYLHPVYHDYDIERLGELRYQGLLDLCLYFVFCATIV